MMREFVVGDIHGCSAALARLDEELQFGSEDRLITLGDYVDRGPDSRGVIDYLIALRERCHYVALRGNHEIMMLRARDEPATLQDWLACGGSRTLESYGSRRLDAVPARHWDFLEQTLRYYETERDFFVHANADPDLPLSEQSDYALFWEQIRDAAPHQCGKRMICGHTAQKFGRPLELDHAVCIDTWIYGEGWLTCLETRSGRYWQARENGELREDALGDY